MKLKIAQVIGLNTDQKAAQVTSSVRDHSDTFLAVLGLSCDDAFTKGRVALSELEDFYFEFEGGLADKLNATFSAAEKKFTEDSNFDLCLAAISGKILYLIGKGQIEVYLKRDSKLSPLLSVGTPSQLISGFLQDSDKLLFSTKSLITFLGEDLEKSLSLPTETFEEEIGGRIGVSDLEDQGLAGLAVEVIEEKLDIPSLPSQEESQQIVQEPSVKPRVLLQTILSKIFALLGRVGTYFPKSNKGRLILAVLLIIIISLGVGYKYKTSKDQEKQKQFTQMVQAAKDDFNAAKNLSSLNPLEAKNNLDSAKDKINKALVLKPKDQEAQDLKKQIEQDASSILQQSSISDFPEFLDLDLVKKNFRATQVSFSAGKLLLLDPAAKTLVVIDIAKKTNQILAGSEKLGEAGFASLNGGLAFIYSQDKGILRVDNASQKVTVVSKKDSDWGDIKDLYAFAGNIYVLDPGKNMIWKYLPTSEGYSDKKEYLSKGAKVDFASSIRMQIDSSIYILKNGGEILRFTKGDKDNFSYSGLPAPVKDPKSFFVSSDTDNLYLLDSGNSRLLILTKTGSYKGEISGQKFAQATDLVVDEKNKKVYLLDGSKIFQVDLK